jgi:hypothetical protein
VRRMFIREQWDVLWRLLESSQRLGAAGARLGDGVTVAMFAEAVGERQSALAEFLKVWVEDSAVVG